ncbi:hypothetical protein [Companilactobacillus sp. FL22-1]|uniref:hypothetical protein n=1 Tax=Companilactobacillus sp. FL22-1 TaxID=3373892 RepID=UPI00375428C6
MDTGKQFYYYENVIRLRSNDEIDASNIKSIRIDKGDAIVEMYDKQKALATLLKYSNMYSDTEQESINVVIIEL